MRSSSAGLDCLSVVLNIEQLAKHLSTTPEHVQKVWKQCDRGAAKVGRSVRFNEADLNAHIQRHAGSASSTWEGSKWH